MTVSAPRAPLFSILTPVYNTPLDVLQDTIDSVRAQTFTNWEWIVVDDHSPDERVRAVLRAAASQDRRIVLVERSDNGHIVRASNDGLERARGEFIALLDHDDLIVPTALERIAHALHGHEDADYLYTDEDKIDSSGRHFGVFRKPRWSPERLYGHMYTCHMSVIRRELMQRIGGFREGFDGSQDYDLVLRVTEQARRIVHVPEVLYHWRAVPGSAAADSNAKPYAYVAAMKAVTESLQRRHVDATVGPIEDLPGNYRITRRLDPSISVSIIVPTRGASGFVWGEKRVFVVEAVRSALAKTDHPIIEVVVVYDEDTPDSVLSELENVCAGRLVLVPYTGPFNFAEKINTGMLASNGSRLVLLNDDVEVISESWLEQLLAPLDEPDVGMTGAKLYFADGSIQHAGLATQFGRYMHPYRGTSGGSPGPMCDLMVSHEVSGVTAACAAIRREVFDTVGGLCEQLPMNYNDVDLCNKVRDSGYRIVWLASCELYHFESKTREINVRPWEEEFIADRWGPPGRDEYLPQDGR